MKEPYIIVAKDSTALLAQEVRKRIEEGYVPVGGVAVSAMGDEYLQALMIPLVNQFAQTS